MNIHLGYHPLLTIRVSVLFDALPGVVKLPSSTSRRRIWIQSSQDKRLLGKVWVETHPNSWNRILLHERKALLRKASFHLQHTRGINLWASVTDRHRAISSRANSGKSSAEEMCPLWSSPSLSASPLSLSPPVSIDASLWRAPMLCLEGPTRASREMEWWERAERFESTLSVYVHECECVYASYELVVQNMHIVRARILCGYIH